MMPFFQNKSEKNCYKLNILEQAYSLRSTWVKWKQRHPSF